MSSTKSLTAALVAAAAITAPAASALPATDPVKVRPSSSPSPVVKRPPNADNRFDSGHARQQRRRRSPDACRARRPARRAAHRSAAGTEAARELTARQAPRDSADQAESLDGVALLLSSLTVASILACAKSPTSRPSTIS